MNCCFPQVQNVWCNQLAATQVTGCSPQGTESHWRLNIGLGYGQCGYLAVAVTTSAWVRRNPGAVAVPVIRASSEGPYCNITEVMKERSWLMDENRSILVVELIFCRCPYLADNLRFSGSLLYLLPKVHLWLFPRLSGLCSSNLVFSRPQATKPFTIA